MSKRRKRPQWERLPHVHPNAAGLDIAAREIWACVPSDRDPEPVRHFGTFTPDLVALVDWLVRCGIDTVAMEATGVYWIPIFELLEARGLQAFLVNARHLKQVPGRKSDFLDCQWIQKLHALGLLAASFRPDAEMCALRAYLRHRAQLLQHRAPHILHIQKALHQMNVQLTQVLTDVTGVTGLAILRAILVGERDPVQLARLRNPACKSSQDQIAKALAGTWRPEHLFVLKQSLELYDFYTAQLAACDAAIEQHFSALKPRWDAAPPADLPPVKPGSRSKNQPALNVRAHLLRLTGVDLVAVHGISASIAQTILSEIGTEMSKWPTEKHFASWLGLAPHNDISGGRVLRSYTLKTTNRAGQAFRQAAQSVARSNCAFGAYYRRMKARLGPEQAIVATAHKIARTVYYLLEHHVPYHDIGAKAYEQEQRQKEILRLQRHAAKLGFSLTLRLPVSPSIAG
jgi:transposase